MLKSIFKKLRVLLISQKKYPDYLKKHLGMAIGSDCEIYKTASFGSEPYLIKIGNHVRINHGVHFINHDGGCWIVRKGMPKFESSLFDVDKFGIIVIGNNVHIGTNSVIMPGVKVGNNVIIGCCAVVTHDVPDNTIVAGVPARPIETVDEYIDKNMPNFVHTKDLNPKEKKEFLLKHFELEK